MTQSFVQVLYSSEQLDTLAVAMTVVKILFVGGALAAAVRIIPLLEDLIRASLKPLHTTLIRNEVLLILSPILSCEIFVHPLLILADTGRQHILAAYSRSSMGREDRCCSSIAALAHYFLQGIPIVFLAHGNRWYFQLRARQSQPGACDLTVCFLPGLPTQRDSPACA